MSQYKHKDGNGTVVHAEQVPTSNSKLPLHHLAKNIRLTNHANAVVHPGDWLIKNEKDEVTDVIRNSIFADIFEPITDASSMVEIDQP